MAYWQHPNPILSFCWSHGVNVTVHAKTFINAVRRRSTKVWTRMQANAPSNAAAFFFERSSFVANTGLLEHAMITTFDRNSSPWFIVVMGSGSQSKCWLGQIKKIACLASIHPIFSRLGGCFFFFFFFSNEAYLVFIIQWSTSLHLHLSDYETAIPLFTMKPTTRRKKNVWKVWFSHAYNLISTM